MMTTTGRGSTSTSPSRRPPPSSSSIGRVEHTPLGRLTFRLVPPSHPHHLPLHASNLYSLASGIRRSGPPRQVRRVRVPAFPGEQRRGRINQIPMGTHIRRTRHEWHSYDLIGVVVIVVGRRGRRSIVVGCAVFGSNSTERVLPRLLRLRLLRCELRRDAQPPAIPAIIEER
jgi:hypothetical protein